ncbi:MAG: cytochrome B [Aureispira sp.]|nr:cytochrome B [Aureispira sp.]
MLSGIKHAHSGLRWIVLILLILAIANAFIGWRNKKSYTDKNKKIHLFAMIFVHIQILIGLIALFLNWGSKVTLSMSNFYMREHIPLMLISMVLMTIGFSKSKKISEDPIRFKTIFIYYTIALVLILASIPWPFRGLGNGWF